MDLEDFVELMAPKLLAETAGMIGMKELKDAFKEVRVKRFPHTFQNAAASMPDLSKHPTNSLTEVS